jgi:DNA processing protein
VPDDVPARPSGFFRRNGVLSAATDATVVVEAGYASGARNTAKAARRLGRPLCVVPHAPWSERGQGCALELAMGARAVSAPRDVLVALGHAPERVRGSRGRPARAPSQGGTAFLHPDEALDATEVAVLAVLLGEPLHIDVVCERSALPMPRVAGALLTLTLKAVVVEEPAGSFRRASSFL